MEDSGGPGSGSFQVIERRERIVTLEARLTHSISHARRWLLTLEWGVWQESSPGKSGPYSAVGGGFMVGGGEETSNGKAPRYRTRGNGITSTSEDRRNGRESSA